MISNCYSDGGNITSALAPKERKAAEAEAAGGRAVAMEGVCSDPRDPVWADWLREHGIRRVIVGHKPSGDSPAVLSSRYTGVEVISGDTSYSDPSAPDSRGVAVAGVMLRGSSLDAMQVSSRPHAATHSCHTLPHAVTHGFHTQPQTVTTLTCGYRRSSSGRCTTGWSTRSPSRSWVASGTGRMATAL